MSEKWTSTYKQKLSSYIINDENHNLFAYRFAFCEFLNVCNLVSINIIKYFAETKVKIKKMFKQISISFSIINIDIKFPERAYVKLKFFK